MEVDKNKKHSKMKHNNNNHNNHHSLNQIVIDIPSCAYTGTNQPNPTDTFISTFVSDKKTQLCNEQLGEKYNGLPHVPELQTNIEIDKKSNDLLLTDTTNNITDTNTTNNITETNTNEDSQQIKNEEKLIENTNILQSDNIPINTKTEQPPKLTLNEIFINLTLISKIEAGNKLTFNDKFVNIDNSYFSFFYRWMNNVDRNNTIVFLNSILNQAYDYNNQLLSNLTYENNLLLFRLTTDLKNSINGLNNLKHTYNNDKLILSALDVTMDDIRSRIDANSKKIKFN